MALQQFEGDVFAAYQFALLVLHVDAAAVHVVVAVRSLIDRVRHSVYGLAAVLDVCREDRGRKDREDHFALFVHGIDPVASDIVGFPVFSREDDVDISVVVHVWHGGELSLQGREGDAGRRDEIPLAVLFVHGFIRNEVVLSGGVVYGICDSVYLFGVFPHVSVEDGGGEALFAHCPVIVLRVDGILSYVVVLPLRILEDLIIRSVENYRDVIADHGLHGVVEEEHGYGTGYGCVLLRRARSSRRYGARYGLQIVVCGA